MIARLAEHSHLPADLDPVHRPPPGVDRRTTRLLRRLPPARAGHRPRPVADHVAGRGRARRRRTGAGRQPGTRRRPPQQADLAERPPRPGRRRLLTRPRPRRSPCHSPHRSIARCSSRSPRWPCRRRPRWPGQPTCARRPAGLVALGNDRRERLERVRAPLRPLPLADLGSRPGARAGALVLHIWRPAPPPRVGDDRPPPTPAAGSRGCRSSSASWLPWSSA